MSTTTSVKTAINNGLNARLLARILDEGYGPGAKIARASKKMLPVSIFSGWIVVLVAEEI